MTFGNPALALGAAAFAIPLIIHILNRSRFRTIEWGAMHLLESVIKVNHRKFHIEQIILLLVRCAIPILLAFCLAQPVLTGTKTLDEDSPVSLVVLLDNSYSMDAAGPSGSKFEAAADATAEIVAATNQGSEISVILTGGTPVPLFDQPVYDSKAVVRRLKDLEGGFGASNMQAALDEGLTTLAGMSHARRELVVISDFQPGDWDDVALDAAAIQSRAKSMDIEPALTLLQVGQPIDSNVSVESLEFAGRALGVGQQLSVRANLRNYGTAAYDSARVIMKIDGAEHSVSQVTLAADGSSQALFPCVFDTPGSHVMEVEVVADDPLDTDNRFAAAVTVWDTIRVLLIDGDPSSEPLQSETDFLAVALTPYTFGRVRLSDLIETRMIPVAELKPELLATTKVAVLANVSKLSEEQHAALSDFVRSGGALLVCAGNRIDLNWYRESMFAGGIGLLPVPFGPLQGKSEDSAAPGSSADSARIVAQHFEHPALEFFNEPSNGDLSTAEIRQWHLLMTSDVTASEETAAGAHNEDAGRNPARTANEKSPNASAPPGADEAEVIVMARLGNGQPLLVERAVGDGVVVQLATSCDADWSDLPMRPVFVPLMQQLVSTMASRLAPPRNISTGEPAVALIEREGDAAADVAPGHSSVSVVTPGGNRRTIRSVPSGRVEVASFTSTQRPGTYTMTLPSTEAIHFVAETQREESDLKTADDTALATLGDAISADVVMSSAEYLEQDRLRRHGMDIWRYVLAALLLFMFLEVVLQQKFARVRT